MHNEEIIKLEKDHLVRGISKIKQVEKTHNKGLEIKKEFADSLVQNNTERFDKKNIKNV